MPRCIFCTGELLILIVSVSKMYAQCAGVFTQGEVYGDKVGRGREYVGLSNILDSELGGR